MRLNLFVSAFIAAAAVLAAAEAMAQCTTKSIPLPNAALLTPPPESGCAFQIASPMLHLASLDYERQCHRDAGVILRDRLLQLQASVSETVKAINRACPGRRQHGPAGLETVHSAASPHTADAAAGPRLHVQGQLRPPRTVRRNRRPPKRLLLCG